VKAFFIKTQYGLAPSDPPSREWFEKIKFGEVVKGEFKRVRNYKFHKKYFALLSLAFDNWEPGEIDSKFGKPEKNFDRFRADLTILAGFYDVTVRLDGSTRIEPKSISFAAMDNDEFDRLYNATIDVLIKHVYKQQIDGERLKELVDTYLSFA